MSYFINISLLRQNRNYRLLYLGQFVSLLGTMITGVALPYQIYHETQSVLMVGLLGLFQLLPLLVTALFGGVLADRHHRRILLLVAESSLAVACLLLAFNASLATPHLFAIFFIASLSSALNGLHRPALNSITQQVVTKKDFNQVGALNTFSGSISVIAGPAIGGLIIANFGLVVTFVIDFFSFAISLLALLMMSHIPKPTRTTDESTWVALKQGIRYAASRQELLGTYFVDFAAMIFGMPTALFPAIAQAYGGAKVLGMFYSAPAVGALVISLFSNWTKRITRQGKAIALAATAWGFAMICFGIATHAKFLWLSLVFLSIAGAFDATSGIFRQTMWNQTIPNNYRGRLAGIEMISYLSGPKLGDTEAGLVAAAFGVSASIISGGFLCILGVWVCVGLLPKFWSYQSETN